MSRVQCNRNGAPASIIWLWGHFGFKRGGNGVWNDGLGRHAGALVVASNVFENTRQRILFHFLRVLFKKCRQRVLRVFWIQI